MVQSRLFITELAVVALFEENGTPLNTDALKVHEEAEGFRITPGTIIKVAVADTLEACEDCGLKHLMVGGMLSPDTMIAFSLEASKHLDSFYETSLANFDSLDTIGIVDAENAEGGEDFLHKIKDILGHH